MGDMTDLKTEKPLRTAPLPIWAEDGPTRSQIPYKHLKSESHKDFVSFREFFSLASSFVCHIRLES